MTATVDVQEGNGADATPTWTTVTSIRFCTQDVYNPGTNNPIPIPTSGYKYSFWKSICLNIAGTFTKVNNVRHYTDGTLWSDLGTGGEVRRGNRDTGDEGCPEASYEQGTGTVGDTGHSIEDGTNGHTYYNGQTTKTADLSGDTEASPATIDSSDHTSAGRTKNIVLQVKVGVGATQGQKTAETFTWKYDEI